VPPNLPVRHQIPCLAIVAVAIETRSAGVDFVVVDFDFVDEFVVDLVTVGIVVVVGERRLWVCHPPCVASNWQNRVVVVVGCYYFVDAVAAVVVGELR
jgi:hypothetical protein